MGILSKIYTGLKQPRVRKTNFLLSSFKSTYPVSFRMATNCLEKPQRGALGSPFINTITFPLLINAFSLSSRLPPALAPANFLHFDVKSGISTPSTRSTAEPCLKKMVVGAAAIYGEPWINLNPFATRWPRPTSCFIEISGKSSAPILMNWTVFKSSWLDSSVITSARCLHSSDQSTENSTTDGLSDLSYKSTN